MNPSGPTVHFLNLEYFFRLIYELFNGKGSVEGSLNFSGILATLSHLWLFFTVLAFLFSLAAIGLLVYSTMRIFQVRKMEESRYHSVAAAEEHAEVEHSRWKYIQELMQSPQEGNWRQAIIEADIMLDESLTRVGYQGATVAEKLKGANPARFGTINNAWEAHKVRNEIAHQGSSYQLSEALARRTISNYESVFREFGEI